MQRACCLEAPGARSRKLTTINSKTVAEEKDASTGSNKTKENLNKATIHGDFAIGKANPAICFENTAIAEMNYAISSEQIATCNRANAT